MRNAAEWFARRAAQEQAQAFVQPPSYQQVQPLQPMYPQQYVQAPPQGYQTGAESPGLPSQSPVAGRRGKEVLDALGGNLLAVASLWRGGKGVKTEHQACPECGETANYFERKAIGRKQTERGTAYPAPYCHNCGYNSLFEQYGAVTPLDPDAPFAN